MCTVLGGVGVCDARVCGGGGEIIIHQSFS